LCVSDPRPKRTASDTETHAPAQLNTSYPDGSRNAANADKWPIAFDLNIQIRPGATGNDLSDLLDRVLSPVDGTDNHFGANLDFTAPRGDAPRERTIGKARCEAKDPSGSTD
jgi:hypothetical protein